MTDPLEKMGKMLCSVFKSSKKEETYLYVRRGEDFKDFPEALMTAFGDPVHVLDMLLTPEKTLARANAKEVLDSIRDKNFFLQLPPPEGVEKIGDATAPKDTLNG